MIIQPSTQKSERALGQALDDSDVRRQYKILRTAILETSDYRLDEISRGQDFRAATLDRLTICHSNYIQRSRAMRRNPEPPRFSAQQKYSRGADCIDY